MRLALLRLLQLLTFWMALTFFFMPVLGTVAVYISVLGFDVQLNSSPDALTEMAWLPPIGLALFWFGHWLGHPIGDTATPGGVDGVWQRSWRAVLLPKPDDELHDFTVCIAQPLTQVVDELKQLPSPRASLVGALTRRKGEPMASVEGKRVTVIAGMGAAGAWLGQLESESETTIVRGAIASPNSLLERFCNSAIAVGFSLASIVLMLGAIVSPASRPVNLVVALLLVWLLSQFVVQHRIARFLAREHERALERFWRAEFDASLELTPRRRGRFDS